LKRSKSSTICNHLLCPYQYIQEKKRDVAERRENVHIPMGRNHETSKEKKKKKVNG
jgi:hypothetical protein